VSSEAIVYAMSIAAAILQVIAVVVAFTVEPGRERHFVWFLIIAALALQAWRRVSVVIAGSHASVFDALCALVVSILLLAGIVMLRRLFADTRAATAELADARAKAELFVDVSGAIIVVMDPDGRFLRINEKGQDILGLPEEHIDIGSGSPRFPSPRCVRSSEKDSGRS